MIDLAPGHLLSLNQCRNFLGLHLRVKCRLRCAGRECAVESGVGREEGMLAAIGLGLGPVLVHLETTKCLRL